MKVDRKSKLIEEADARLAAKVAAAASPLGRLKALLFSPFGAAAALSLAILAFFSERAVAAIPLLAFMGAVANTKSNIVTNADAMVAGTSYSMTNARTKGGKRREQAATVETAAADDAGSVYRLHRVKSSDRISQLLIAHDALTNMSTADIGLYDIATVNAGAVVDVDFFADAVDMSSASSGLVDRTYERTNTRISDIEKPLWEQLGLTSDPNKEYDIAVTATTNDPSAAGTISGLVGYVAHNG